MKSTWIEFKDLRVGDHFQIPNDNEGDRERFVKLKFNKAVNIISGTVHNFTDLTAVWTFD